MKNSELIILESYFNNWLSVCDVQVEKLALQSNKLAQELLENRMKDNVQNQIEGNIHIMRKTTEVFQKISEISSVKASIYQITSFINGLVLKREDNEIDMTIIKPYVHERLLDQLLTLLEEKEMYENCVFVKNHLLEAFHYNRDAA